MTRSPRTRHMLGAVFLMALLGVLDPSAVFASETVTYTYDALGRVTSATYGSGIVINYTYDAAGNRTQQNVSNPSTPTLIWTATSGSCTANCWGSSNWGP